MNASTSPAWVVVLPRDNQRLGFVAGPMGHDHHRRGPQGLDVELDAPQLVEGDVEPDGPGGRHEGAQVRDAQHGTLRSEVQIEALPGLQEVEDRRFGASTSMGPRRSSPSSMRSSTWSAARPPGYPADDR
jgi:hypothetical protein